MFFETFTSLAIALLATTLLLSWITSVLALRMIIKLVDMFYTRYPVLPPRHTEELNYQEPTYPNTSGTINYSAMDDPTQKLRLAKYKDHLVLF